jgi:hypothetical protein
MPEPKCQHNRLRWAAGGLFIRCKECSRQWIACDELGVPNRQAWLDGVDGDLVRVGKPAAAEAFAKATRLVTEPIKRLPSGTFEDILKRPKGQKDPR